MDSFREEKVKKFEEFVDLRLKPDLVHAIAQRDKVFEQQKVFSDLKRNIENLEKNGVTCLRTSVNLGSEVYMQADVPDTRHIFVDVGLGFHVEFTWTEALEFTSVKEARLARNLGAGYYAEAHGMWCSQVVRGHRLMVVNSLLCVVLAAVQLPSTTGK